MFHQSDSFVTFKHQIKELNEQITKMEEEMQGKNQDAKKAEKKI